MFILYCSRGEELITIFKYMERVYLERKLISYEYASCEDFVKIGWRVGFGQERLAMDSSVGFLRLYHLMGCDGMECACMKE